MASPKTPFKIIIIGGSVSGLTLAHMLNAASIPYTLLEARDVINPSMGASIVVMPNGARILDQLGVYDRMWEEFLYGMKRAFVRKGEDGALMGDADWPRLVEERLGYACGIAERRVFLKSLYDQLENKERVLLNKKVLGIKHVGEEVVVRCQDGSEYWGDLVVGADGIHSKTRGEMKRYVEEFGPPGLMDEDKNSITCEYSCFFGLGAAMPGLVPGDSHTSRDLHHSSLLFVGKDGIPQWFFTTKLPRIYHETEIPRYTKQQMEAHAKEYEKFYLTENLTMKEMLENTTSLSFLPLEEANHKVWTCGRIVCLGDAMHKMTPNAGQGGNQAIESAAVLTNCLLTLLSQNQTQPPTLPDLQASLQKYQNLRQERSGMFVKVSGLVTRNDALATLRHTLAFLYFPQMDGEAMAKVQMGLYSTAPFLEFLPLPKRTVDNQFWKKGMKKVKMMEGASKPRAKI